MVVEREVWHKNDMFRNGDHCHKIIWFLEDYVVIEVVIKMVCAPKWEM